MLKPKRITQRETEKIIEHIGVLAENPEYIDESVQTTEARRMNARKLQEFLYESSIYQYELPDLPHGKVILSHEVYKKLLECTINSINFEAFQKEFGVYLFGKELDDNVILFDRVGQEKPDVGTREFNTTNRMESEIRRLMRYDSVDCICHVHTHPYGDGIYSGTPSNQDLYTYAWFQEQFETDGKNISFMGGLISPTEHGRGEFNDICFIFYDKNYKRFYKITDVFYVTENGDVKKLPKTKYVQKRNGRVESIEERTVLFKNPNN